VEKLGLLKFQSREYLIRFKKVSKVAEEFAGHLPLTSIVKNIGGEIYFRIPGVEIEYDGTQEVEFKIGDVVYWRSPEGEKIFSIALFYGNTSYSSWKSPRASSNCIKIGEIENTEGLGAIESGETVHFVLL
jgi:hypothetical protein